MAEQRLDLRMNQQLVMTPQLRMAIQLLQMNTLDLQSFLEQELLDNPFLSKEDGTSEEEYDVAGNDKMAERENSDGEHLPDEMGGLDMGWDSMYDAGRGASQAAPLGDEANSWEATATQEQTLRGTLLEQLGLATADPVLRFLVQYLIDTVDDAGYLHLDFNQTAKQLGVEVSKLEEALVLLQSFEPTGVGARNLAECLRLQLEANGQLDDPAKMVLANLEILARHDIGKLAKLAGCTSEEMQQVCERIVQLTPKPGLKYGVDVASNVVPDLIVSKDTDGNWQVELNVDAMPRLLVQQQFKLASKSSSDDKTFVTEKMGRAQWLVKSLEQRAKTIYKVGNALLKFQRDFFDYGVEHLQPLTLKTVADAVEVHESTVSRVTNGKYLQTPMGVFELKYFFSSAIGTTGGTAEVAAESVKAIIRRIVKEENSSKPYSDEKLVSMLKKEGIDVARRTVAKYREALGIPSSSQRRVRL